MREGRRGRKVRLERLALRRGRGLRQQVDDLRYLGFCGNNTEVSPFFWSFFLVHLGGFYAGLPWRRRVLEGFGV